MTEREQQPIIKHRLAVIQHADEVTGNVAATCRDFGISRQCFYTWLRRFEEDEEGLRERSRRPLTSPRANQSEVVGKIIYLRRHYHQGPQKISTHLKRYHDVDISASGVWRILKKLDMNRLPPPSATSATPNDGSATRSRCRVTASKSASSSSSPSPA